MVRRPHRGIEIKEDTYAIAKVVRSDGREIPLFDSSSPDGLTSDGYANFLIQGIQEARMEKHQIVETFGLAYLFLFGENPRFIDVTAVLLNSHDFNWRAEWWENYENYLRGSKLAELGARLYLFWDDVVAEGYMLNASTLENAAAPYQLTLQFRMFLTNYKNLSFIGAPDNASFPIRSSITLPDRIDLTASGVAEELVSTFRGQNFDAANAEGTPEEGASLLRTFETGANPFVSGRKASDLIRNAARSSAVSEQVWSDIINNPAVNPYSDNRGALILRNGQPIRGLISDNTDEFTGRPTDDLANPYNDFSSDESGMPSNISGTVRSQLEVNDFFRTAIEALSCFGADIDSPDAMVSLGMAPNFGVSTGVSAGATTGASTGFGSFGQDPLSSVYGRSSSSSSSTLGGSENASYGYQSDFSSGPGYGQPGYGDMGGVGFGSALGASGDPGFKDPSKFTFAGVTDARGAFQRFQEARRDATAFGQGNTMGIGAGAGAYFGTNASVGALGTSSGASIGVGGSVTAFAFVSVGGTLDPTGQSRGQTASIAAKLAQTKFGFSNDNPFGVNCTPRSDGGGEDLANPYT